MTASAQPAANPVAEPELRGLLAQVERHRDSTRLLFVAAAPTWDGPDVLDTDDGPVRVVTASSPLAVRVAMLDHPDDFLAVLTPVPADELGGEVLARAWRGTVRRPSPWDAVTSLFRVTGVDPSLRDDRWMVDLLVRLAPPGGYPQPSSGVLDRGTAWATLFRRILGLAADDPTSTAVLTWAATPSAADAVGRLDPAERDRVAIELDRRIGPAAGPVLARVAASAGADVVPFGLVVDALWPTPDSAAKLLLEERHLDRARLDDRAALDWGRAAVALVRDRLDRHGRGAVQGWTDRADDILADIDPEGRADSALLDRGFTARLQRLGGALTVALDRAAPEAVAEAEHALGAVEGHIAAAEARGRVEAARAAVRLARRTVAGGRPAVDGDDLTTLAWDYLGDGGFVDAARHRVADGDAVADLGRVYARLQEHVDTERRDRDRRFAAAVAAEVVGPPPAASTAARRPLRIEQVLDAVVAPLAAQAPVLLLVVDGLSHAAAVPLLDDLRADGWRPHGPDGRALPPVAAALPTITVVSRASLLCGRLATGGRDVERDGFTQHRGVVEATVGRDPVLFHKADLKTAAGDPAPAPRQALADPTRRVVGVVVNAVDDHLDRGHQLQLEEGLAGIPVLGGLLDAAIEAGRVVVLTSDHGHILGDRQRVVPPNGGGERYRLVDDQPPADDEVLLAGKRVLKGDGRVVAAADEGVRYVGVSKHGYHGGATPAEVLCPLAVLVSRAVDLDGWEPLAPAVPAWWDPEVAPVVVHDDTPGAAAPAAPDRADPVPQLSLLEPPAPAPARDQGWLRDLLASARLADQRLLAGRTALDDDDLAALLRVLVAAGGTVSGGALQRSLDVPGMRLRGKLEAARSLINVEGYQVLRLEGDGTAALNLDLLAQQFGLDRAAIRPRP